MHTRKISLIIFQVILFHFSVFSQDCNCNRWKRTSYDTGGRARYDYSHSCNMGSEWEFVGYDAAYCLEQERRKKEMEEFYKSISDNLKKERELADKNEKTKLLQKDGYTITNWYYPYYTPTIGTNNSEIDNYIWWSVDGDVLFSGTTQHGLLHGIMRWNPIEKTRSIYSYQKIPGDLSVHPLLTINFLDKDYNNNHLIIYGYDRMNNTHEQIDLTKIKEKYIDFLVENGKILMAFTKGSVQNDKLTSKDAYAIYEKIIATEFNKAKQNRIQQFTEIKTKMEEIFRKDSLNLVHTKTKIMSVPLTQAEKTAVGKWTFESKINYSIYKAFDEKLELNEDRTYNVEIVQKDYDLNREKQVVVLTKTHNPYLEKGFWKIEKDSLYLYRYDESNQQLENYEKTLYSFVCARLTNIDQEFSKEVFFKYETFKTDRFFENHENLAYVNWNEKLEYNNKLHSDYMNKIKALENTKSYMQYVLFLENRSLSKSHVLHISAKTFNRSISPEHMLRNKNHTIPSSSQIILKGYPTNKTSSVQKNRKIKRSITKVGFVGGLVWISLRTLEYISVK